MAIIQSQETQGLRLGSVQNAWHESLVQENYMSDMIKAYGLDINYYKLKTPYPEVFKPILDSRMLGIHAYGEDYTPEFHDEVKMIAYIKWEQDGIVLNSYGIQPDSSMTMWVNQTDFAIAMAKHLSQWRSYKVVGNSEFILDFDNDQDLIDNREKIDIVFHTDLFDGSLNALFTDETFNQVLTQNSCSLDGEYRLEKPITVPCRLMEHGKLKIDTGRINPMLYKGNHYDPFEDDLVDCHLHLEIVSILRDRENRIRIMGGIRGEVIYYDTEVVGKYINKIGPEVGDLIDIHVPDESGLDNIYHQKYEVVQVIQANNEGYMNPFLRTNIYEMSLRAYVASGQEEPNAPTQSQVELQDKLDLINTATEEAVKKVSCYEDFEDNVYGGYQKVNTRGNPSVQRDVKNSTINDFSKPRKTKGLKKTTEPLFIFKDINMVLSLVDDPKNSSTFLTLTPGKRTTVVDKDTQYLDYLRCDDDSFVLVNGNQAYLYASRFKNLEIDEETYCNIPVRLKHEVYGQKGGWADQPFSLMNHLDEKNELTPFDESLNMNLQDLIGVNSTPDYVSASENRITFPQSRTFLEVVYERPEEEDFEIWTCFVYLASMNPENTKPEERHGFPICSYIRKRTK